MTIALLPHRIYRFGRLTRVRETVRSAVANLPVRKPESQPTVNAGRWATLPGEYAGPWACPLDARLPAITAPGVTAPVACGANEAVVLHLAGTWRGQVAFEGSVDGHTWRCIALFSLASGATENGTDCPGLWRTLPDQPTTYLRLAITDLPHGAILASVSAALPVLQQTRRALDSAA